MNEQPDILCIGSVLWDVIGRTPVAMHSGADVPGRISRLPGGVAMNVAMTLRRFGMRPALLSCVGADAAGDELVARAGDMGLVTRYLYRPADLPTDAYMAIEAAGGLVAAVADAHSLEQAGADILVPLADGRLGTADAPWSGPVAVDGNLTEDLLAEIAHSPLFARADLRLAPASPGKALRLRALLGHPSATFYVNLEEAGLLCGTTFPNAGAGAAGLCHAGARRAIVTDGGRAVAMAQGDSCTVLIPPPVRVARVTGAGDTFMAAHIASETQGPDPDVALERAMAAAANYVSGTDP